VSRARRFSLIELLVVVAILSVVAGGLALSYGDGVEDSVAEGLAQRELVEVKRAVLAFRNDTGHLPGQGPFALAPGQGQPSLEDPLGAVRLEGGSAAASGWFSSRANLHQLLENPLRSPVLYDAWLSTPQSDQAPLEHSLATWNPDRRRGWRGPYLPREGRVDLGAGADLRGTLAVLDVPAVVDPFQRAAEPTGAFQWRSEGGVASERSGRPYFLIYDAPAPTPLDRARVVSCGPDGVLGTADDLEARLR
jgi:prepilin-type N-terminal cleavage/methylation domain-containing protein